MDWREVDYPTAAVIVVVVVTGAALFVGLSTSAAAYGPYNYQWDGGAEFRTTVAAASGSASVARSTTAYEEADAGDSVAFVVSPTGTYRPSEAARVRQFVSRGGTISAVANKYDRLLQSHEDDFGRVVENGPDVPCLLIGRDTSYPGQFSYLSTDLPPLF